MTRWGEGKYVKPYRESIRARSPMAMVMASLKKVRLRR